ncbi:MAG: GNAT family N-acetyltransferase [Bacteroidetes bacterium]|nr:GNAT family N-acetyltransferase [Bacteroidota bacterium]MBU1580767.1 GNAT family N-acetyltransferase [Bacteroidota bacterium]MBU2465337.1 GNAT family N-acetyltransferase [Bacteroidota bacterium]MBU2557453.1 GNAT family N-acetyltransferase [Bacteroidota bacterium]
MFNDLKIKQLDRKGLDTLISWAAAEGWNPGPYDAEVFWQTDSEAYVGYYHNNILIAGGSIVSYDGHFGFMGFFIVQPEFRSQGIGQKLWTERRNLLLSRLKPGAAIGMDGVVAMQDFYRRGGFELAFRDERYERIGEQFEVDNQVSGITAADFPAVVAYDTACFGVPRPHFIKPWLLMPESYRFKFVHKGSVKGFAVLRKAGHGFKIGPLFASDALVAEALYRACLNAVPGEAVFLDIPVNNPGAVQLVKNYKANYVFECARMYYGKPPVLQTEKIYGITTFELG